MIDNEITLFEWGNRLSDDEVTNLGYGNDLILINMLFDMIKIDQ